MRAGRRNIDRGGKTDRRSRACYPSANGGDGHKYYRFWLFWIAGPVPRAAPLLLAWLPVDDARRPRRYTSRRHRSHRAILPASTVDLAWPPENLPADAESADKSRLHGGPEPCAS